MDGAPVKHLPLTMGSAKLVWFQASPNGMRGHHFTGITGPRTAPER